MRKLRKISRRSFLSTVAGGALSGALLAVSDHARAAQGCSDSDPSDPIGRGRRCTYRPRTGCSDRDPTDPGGAGVRCTATGCSDSDPTDPVGSGRRCRSGNVYSGCSDSDPTDPGGRGVRCGGRMAETSLGACTLCSCSGYVRSDDINVTACARQGCGHSYQRHALPERCPSGAMRC